MGSRMSILVDICREDEQTYYEIGEEKWTLGEITDMLKREAEELE